MSVVAEPCEDLQTVTDRHDAREQARHLRVTREGWVWLLVAGLLWGTGLYKGINLVTLLGTLMAVAWAANLILAARCLRDVRLERWVVGEVFAGVPARLKVSVENRGRRADVGVRVRGGGPGDDSGWFVVGLAARGRRRLLADVVFPRRGLHHLGPIRASSGYPLGLAEGSIERAAGPPVLVYPWPVRLKRQGLRRLLTRLSSSSMGRQRRLPQQHPAAQTEFHSLRAFRAGDSPRLIHWRTSARRNELMVREFEDTPSDHLILVLDPWSRDSRRAGDGQATARADRSAERVIRVAAAVCREWCRQPGDRLVLAAAGADMVLLSGLTGVGYQRRLLEALALLEPALDPQPSRLVDALARQALPPGPVMVLTAAPSHLAQSLADRLGRRVASAAVGQPAWLDLVDEEEGDAA